MSSSNSTHDSTREVIQTENKDSGLNIWNKFKKIDPREGGWADDADDSDDEPEEPEEAEEASNKDSGNLASLTFGSFGPIDSESFNKDSGNLASLKFGSFDSESPSDAHTSEESGLVPEAHRQIFVKLLGHIFKGRYDEENVGRTIYQSRSTVIDGEEVGTIQHIYAAALVSKLGPTKHLAKRYYGDRLTPIDELGIKLIAEVRKGRPDQFTYSTPKKGSKSDWGKKGSKPIPKK